MNNTRLVCSLKLVGRLFQSCTARRINVFFAVPVSKFLMSLKIWSPTLSASCRVLWPGLLVLVHIHWFLVHLGLEEQDQAVVHDQLVHASSVKRPVSSKKT